MVLLLGRFTSSRKPVLDALHAELRARGYIPVLFDFERPRNRNTTETVLTLAGMARFVIADLTDAASVQHELSAIAFSPLSSVSVQPVILRASQEWSMFADVQLKGPILNPHYTIRPNLIEGLSEFVIDPAEQEAEARNDRAQRTSGTAVSRKASARANQLLD
jgi:hypothetical protein